jgi:RNA polymerase sigma-70 factor (ECF subfamily)
VAGEPPKKNLRVAGAVQWGLIGVGQAWGQRMDVEERTAALLGRLRARDGEALGELFELHRERLWRMLYVRLDRRVSSRVSPDDVLQEAFLDVARRIGEYLADPAVPFYVWLRFLTVQRMQMVQRLHLGAQIRDVTQEVALVGSGVALASTESMAGQLVSHLTSPSQAAIRHELQARLRQALDEMDPLDREVLALRHFEELGNNEVAEVLGISKDAASKRHVRALVRLREILTDAGSFPT